MFPHNSPGKLPAVINGIGSSAIEGQQSTGPLFIDEDIKLPELSEAAKTFLDVLAKEPWDEVLDFALDSAKEVSLSKGDRQCLKCRHAISGKARFCENCGADQEAGLKSARKGQKTAGQAPAEKVRAQKPTSEKAEPVRRKSQKPTDLPE